MTVFLFDFWSTASRIANLQQANHTVTVTLLCKQELCLDTI